MKYEKRKKLKGTRGRMTHRVHKSWADPSQGQGNIKTGWSYSPSLYKYRTVYLRSQEQIDSSVYDL